MAPCSKAVFVPLLVNNKHSTNASWSIGVLAVVHSNTISSGLLFENATIFVVADTSNVCRSSWLLEQPLSSIVAMTTTTTMVQGDACIFHVPSARVNCKYLLNNFDIDQSTDRLPGKLGQSFEQHHQQCKRRCVSRARDT
jgi:hypothetical protein